MRPVRNHDERGEGFLSFILGVTITGVSFVWLSWLECFWKIQNMYAFVVVVELVQREILPFHNE